MPKRHACLSPCESALVILKLAIYENVFHTLRKFRGMLVGGFVRNRGGIKYRYIGKISWLEETSIKDTFTLCGKGSDLSDLLLQWDQVLIAHVMAQKTRHAAERAWMRLRFEQRPIEGEFARIQTNADPRLFQTVTQIVFAGNEIQGAGLRFIGEN